MNKNPSGISDGASLIQYVLNYRWQSLRSTNPGTLKSGNCFELPSEQGQLRVSNRG